MSLIRTLTVITFSICATIVMAQSEGYKNPYPIDRNADRATFGDYTIMEDDSLTHGYLANGMEYYIYSNQMRKLNTMSFRLVQKSGAAMECQEESGISHFVEHMLFNGSKHFGMGEIKKYAQSLGGRTALFLNAITRFESVEYKLDEVSVGDNEQRLDSCLMILHDWACDATLADEYVDHEREVILSEKVDRTDISPEINRFLFHEDIYGNDILGTEESLKNMTGEKLRRYYKKWYQPQNQAILIIGDGIDREKIKTKVESKFSDIAKGKTEIPVTGKRPERRSEPRVMSYKKDALNDATVFLSFDNDRTTDKEQCKKIETCLHELMMTEIKELIEKRLMNLMSANPKIKNAFIDDRTSDDISRKKRVIIVAATCQAEEWRDVLTAVTQEIARIQRYGWMSNEMRNGNDGDGETKDDVEYDPSINWNLPSGYQRPNFRDGFDNEIGIQHLSENCIYGKPIAAYTYKSRLNDYNNKHISQAQLYRHLVDMLDNNRLSIGVMLPESSTTDKPNEIEVLNTYYEAMKEDLSTTKYVHATKSIPQLLREAEINPTPGHIVKIDILNEGTPLFQNDSVLSVRKEQFEKGEEITNILASLYNGRVVHITLTNGVEVDLLETMHQNMIAMANKVGGYNLLSDDEIRYQQLFDYALTSIVPSEGDNFFNYKITDNGNESILTRLNDTYMHTQNPLSKSNLEDQFKFLYAKLMPMKADKEKFGRYIESRKNANIEIERNDLSKLNDYYMRLIYDNNMTDVPFSYEELKNIDVDKVAETASHLRSNYRGVKIYINSQYKAEEMIPFVEKYLGALPSSETPDALTDRRRFHYKTYNDAAEYYYESATPHAEVLVTYVQGKDADISNEGLATINAAVDILYRAAYDRLREDNGYIYSLMPRWFYGTEQDKNIRLLMQTSCDPKDRYEVVKIIHETMGGISKGELDIENYLTGYKNYSTANIAKNNASKADLLGVEDWGKNTHNYMTEDLVRALTPEKIRQFFNGLLEKGNKFDFIMTTKE